MNRHLLLRLPFLAVLALLPCAGCLPNVVWLPDSSGFLYTLADWPERGTVAAEQRDRLFHFDLAQKKSRVVAQAVANTIGPALSPDGKRVAVADSTPGLKGPLHVIVYDLQGKEAHRSKPLPWGDGFVEQIPAKYPQLFWSPQGNKVLVFANRHAGIYDLDTNQVVMLGAAWPLTHGTTPVRPDGKGFLLGKEGRKIAFADWAGKETFLALPQEIEQQLGVGADILQAPVAVCWTRWEGEVAIATWKKGQLRIDTDKKTVTFRQPEPAEWSLEGKEIQELYTFPDGKTRVAVLYLKSYRDFRDAGLATVCVELLGPAPGQQRTLVTETFHCGLHPSPNKGLVALRYFTQDAQSKLRDMILVVNQKGETVAELGTGK